MSETNAFQVIIVGAGPAGASAAAVLARNGIRTAVLDKAALPRYKTCGGGILYRTLQLLPSRVTEAIERNCLRAELNFVERGLHFVTERTQPIVAMTMRSNLDYALVQEAVELGACVIDRCSIQGVRTTESAVELTTSAGVFQASFVIGADGANSLVAKQSGLGLLTNLIPALEYEIEVDDADFERLSQTVRFDFEVVSHGYAWVFPKKQHLSVGLLSTRRGGVDLQAALTNYLELLHLEPKKIDRHGYVIPIMPRPGGFARGRTLLAGDAAGLADPVTAEGISHAILSGRLAAQALVDCHLDPVASAAEYHARLASGLLRELKAARFLARILYGQPKLAAWLFRRHGQRLSELVTDIVMGKRQYTELLGKPQNYWKLLSN